MKGASPINAVTFGSHPAIMMNLACWQFLNANVRAIP
mgnify:CR=1 FL=1